MLLQCYFTRSWIIDFHLTIDNIAILYTYTAERRDVLGFTSLTTKRFPEAWEMSRGRSPRDISRAGGNLEVGRDVKPNTSRLKAVYGHSLIINLSLGMYQQIHPSRAVSIYSVKINTSLLMMRECCISKDDHGFKCQWYWWWLGTVM